MVPAIHGAPHLTPCEPDSDWTAAAGTAPFVFVHAPIEPRNNQYLIVRAAMHAGLPVLMAGPVADTTYFQAVKRISGERVAFIGDVPPGTASALYRRARVYADLSWMPYGLARVAAAGASGCALVLARGGNAADLFGTSAWTADPCSVDSIALALGDAWMHAAEEREVASGAGRIAAWADPAAALRATVQAYAAAQQAKVHA
jgi:glycosyltransferase involved in cell wall biosynthesis